ncbi:MULTISPECIES: efflux RND transporter periplasmic adaptor subunit [Deefgea]|uniref:Efflux RND transporter periplasmic adaptor subunit n=1 Tax=Deefgea chitinilytica TaxID=570276 RepID=A0ABS2C9G4_9NEIS|nr:MULTISPECIES: efflux RND transporter periplasmic adaptor subunit [Deefgea]MBM5570795.1 efflux RND transporter periplasmic adaptor subunit [Deefgea chitinilytica]MBM9888024.1 efflux RND transporter periplasmic adaptor subunit [Deefgea sp. CFH1-16]
MQNTTKTICSITASLFVLTTLAACNKAPEKKERPPAPVTVIEIKPTDVPFSKEMIGETAGYRDVEVRSRVNGILLKRTYVEGQNVQAGQVLFEIDPEPYKAILDQAKGVLSQAASNLDKARADKDRITPLFKENAVSRKDFDDANAAYNAAVASHDAAQASVRQAALNLEYTKVTAPISGMTSKLAQSEGSLISANGESGKLTTITQYNPLYVNFSYSEQDRQELESAQRSGSVALNASGNFPAKLKLADGSVYPVTGQVNFSDNRVDTTTGTIRARAIFKNEKGELLPGQFVRITLDLGTLKNAISIPARAVVQSQADFLVMTVDKDNKVVPKPVTIRPSTDGQVIISKGLSAGDKVITEGQMKAPPGSTVKPMIASAPAASK